MKESSSDIFTPVGEPLRLSEAPTVVAGLDDAVPLHRVGGGVLLPDGVAITNGNEILIFDGAGVLVARQGQTGQGPGDYKSLQGLDRYRSGLLAWDIGLLRFTLLDANGEYAGHTKEIAPRRSDGSLMFPTLVGAFGSRVLFQYETLGLPGEGVREPHRVRLEDWLEIYDVESGDLVLETSWAGKEQWAARTEDGPHGGLPVVFGRRAMAAVANGRAYIADTDSLTVTELDENGETRTISLPHRPVRAKPGWVSIVKDSIRARIRAMPPIADFRLMLLEGLPARATLPSFAALKGGSDGHVWVQAYPAPDQDHVTWVALDDTWNPRLWVEMPVHVRVMDLAEDRVLVRDRGPVGEEVVKVYSFRPRTP